MSCPEHLEKIAAGNRWNTIRDGRKGALEGRMNGSNTWLDVEESPAIQYITADGIPLKRRIYEGPVHQYIIGVGELATLLAKGEIAECSMTDKEIGRLIGAMNIALQHGRSARRADEAGKDAQNAIAAAYILGAVIIPELPSYFLDRMHRGTGSAVMAPDAHDLTSGLMDKVYKGKNGVGSNLLKALENTVKRFPTTVGPISRTLERYQRKENAA